MTNALCFSPYGLGRQRQMINPNRLDLNRTISTTGFNYETHKLRWVSCCHAVKLIPFKSVH